MDEDLIEMLTAALGVARVPQVRAPINARSAADCASHSGSYSPGVTSGWITNVTLFATRDCLPAEVDATANLVLKIQEEGRLVPVTAAFIRSLEAANRVRRFVHPNRAVHASLALGVARQVIYSRAGHVLTPSSVMQMVTYQHVREVYVTVPVHQTVSPTGVETLATVPVGAARMFLDRFDPNDVARSVQREGGMEADSAAADASPYVDLPSLFAAVARATLTPAYVLADASAHLRAAALMTGN